MKKIVVMGGSFNPPTIAHQKILLYILEQSNADKGIFVPSPYNYVYAKMEQKGMPEETLSDELSFRRFTTAVLPSYLLISFSDFIMSANSDISG